MSDWGDDDNWEDPNSDWDSNFDDNDNTNDERSGFNDWGAERSDFDAASTPGDEGDAADKFLEKMDAKDKWEREVRENTPKLGEEKPLPFKDDEVWVKGEGDAYEQFKKDLEGETQYAGKKTARGEASEIHQSMTRREMEALEGQSPDSNAGLASIAQIKSQQLSHSSPEVRQAFIDARAGVLDTSRSGKDMHDVGAAMQTLAGDMPGQSPDDIQVSVYADQLPGNVKSIDPRGYEMGDEGRVMRESKASPNAGTIALALGFAEKSDDYYQKGVGGTLPGNIMEASVTGETSEATMERRNAAAAEHAEGLEWATDVIRNLSGRYIHKATRARGGDVLAAREEAVFNANMKRMMESTAKSYGDDIIPLPNEVGVYAQGDQPVHGLVPTKSWKGFGGSPYTRLQFQMIEDEFSDRENNPAQMTKYKQLVPDVRNSLMPVDWNNKFVENPLEARNKEWDTLVKDVQKARKIIRGQTITNQDEDYGNTQRSSGWQKNPAGDREATAGFWEEGQLYDLSLGGGSDASTGKTDAKGMKGSDRSGMYGAKARSEMDMYIDARVGGASEDEAYAAATSSAQAGNTVFSDLDLVEPGPDATDYEKYMWAANKDMKSGKIHTQGSEGWHEQRKGKITASVTADLMEDGVDATAVKMGLKKYGDKLDRFHGNAYTRAGNDAEAMVQSVFQGAVGDKLGLTVAEDFFRVSEENDRIGASPDGRLFNEDGSSAGLLELKFLTPGAMKGAHDKYRTQMQTQMLVTGETQTHFFALDQYTGDYVHEIEEADPQLQAEIMRRAKAGIEAFDGITSLKEAVAMRNKIQSSAPRSNKSTGGGVRSGGGKVATAEEALFVGPTGPALMTAFDPDTKLGKKSTGLMEEAVARAGGRQGPHDTQALQDKIDTEVLDDLHDSALKENDARDEATDGLDGFTKALNESSDSMTSNSGVIKMLTAAFEDAAKAVQMGNDSAMDEVRFAAETGMDLNATRGLRKALETGGATTEGSSRIMSSAGRLQQVFNDEQTLADKHTTFASAVGKSNLPGVRSSGNIPINQLRNISPQEFIATVKEKIDAVDSPEEKAAIARIYEMPELAAVDQSAAVLGSAVGDVDEAGARNVQKSFTFLEQVKREGLEEAGSIEGETGKNAARASWLQNEAGKWKSTNNTPTRLVAAAGGGGMVLGGITYDVSSAVRGEVEERMEAGQDSSNLNPMTHIKNWWKDGRDKRDERRLENLDKLDTSQVVSTVAENSMAPPLISNVNVEVNNNADGTEVNTDNNGAIDQENYILE